MKVLNINECDLETCIKAARRQHVVVTRNGKPIAVVVGVKGLDLEQVELGYSDEFWKMISERRRQKTITREELERRLAEE
jgi:antitoxin (DNA-binding transcriptional repressor) of toxin-antitoxin stability system